jgi:hypothetical protein
MKRHLNDISDRTVRQCSLTGNEKICAKNGEIGRKKERITNDFAQN